MDAPKPQPSSPQELTKKRLDELKARVKSDYYDSPELLISLADRLLHSGDLRDDSD